MNPSYIVYLAGQKRRRWPLCFVLHTVTSHGQVAEEEVSVATCFYIPLQVAEEEISVAREAQQKPLIFKIGEELAQRRMSAPDFHCALDEDWNGLISWRALLILHTLILHTLILHTVYRWYAASTPGEQIPRPRTLHALTPASL